MLSPLVAGHEKGGSPANPEFGGKDTASFAPAPEKLGPDAFRYKGFEWADGGDVQTRTEWFHEEVDTGTGFKHAVNKCVFGVRQCFLLLASL